MALTISLTPGVVVTSADVVSPALLNQLANPTVLLEGSVGSLSLADGSVTTPKLADGALSADSTGRAKMADNFITLAKILDGIFTADATGRAKIADNFVNTAKLLDANVTGAKLDNSARGDVHQFAVASLSAGVYTVTLSPAATAYVAGMEVKFVSGTIGANAGSVSVNVNGLGNKTIQKLSLGGALVNLTANDIYQNQMVRLVYDGTVFQIMPSSNTGFYLSPTQAVATGVIALAHGLAAVPARVRWVLVCGTTDLGYAVGDEVGIEGCDASGTAVAVTPAANATNVYLAVQTTGIDICRRDTGVRAGITPASWTFRAYVWAY